ncbi:acyltransferase [Cupriavidus basilensis]|uniref:acyltransferase n=1 Tax=Cupriavidus basilensis TaxID=68895 RepID=UPI0006987E4F|nr:acyltransferase [Cupriavidus basilensis]
MFRRLYLSPAGYAISAVLNLLGMLLRPFMVYGYFSRREGRFLRFTRVSSSAKILSERDLVIGDHCWIGPHCLIDASGGVEIGEGVQISSLNAVLSHSSHVSIRLLGRHFISTPTPQRTGFIQAPVAIGDFTFVGSGAIILPGTRIGKGCVIGAGSVVRGEIPDHSVVVGNPGRIVGTTEKYDLEFVQSSGLDNTFFDPDRLAELRRVAQSGVAG